jgi:hypothetical protein
MNCSDVKQLIDSVFDGEVPVETIAAATHHMEGCADCHTQYHELESLHERTVRYASQIPIPKNLEAAVKAKLEREGKTGILVPRWYFVAAACLLLVGVLSFIFSASRPAPQVAVNPPAKEVIAERPKVPVTVDDLVQHTNEHKVDYVDYSPTQLTQLSKETGFEVKPMKPSGWQIADVCICDIGTHGQSVVHITYTRMENHKRRFLTCYQSLKHTFDCSQMYKEKGAGREIHCAQSGNLSIAYTSNDNLENVFVASMPVKDLVHIAKGA